MSVLSIGTSGLLATQRALDTIAHNISNAGNPDYNRQETQLTTKSPMNAGYGFVGSGVEISQVKRIVDSFVTESIRIQESNFNQVDIFSRVTERVSDLLADSTIGVSEGLNQFFSSMQELSNDPASIPARQLLISNAQVLERRFTQLAGQIETQKQNVNKEITQIVTDINRIANNIAESNVKIITLSGGQKAVPNDLLDARDALIQELSQYVEVKTTTQEDGSLNIFMGNGQTLVIGATVSRIGIEADVADASRVDVTIITPASSQVITESIYGGKLGGLLEVTNNVLNKSENSLGRIATTFALALNQQHRLGIDLNAELGSDLFNNVNDIRAQLDRVLSSTSNQGNAIFKVAINEIQRPSTETVNVIGEQSNLVDATTLTPLATNLLSLNGVNIRSTIAGDDTLSTSDALASAVAIASAINSSTLQHGVTASVETTSLNLGSFTPGAFAAGEFQINGTSIITTGVDNATLVQDINALSQTTGVIAYVTENQIVLNAQDGRNIQLTSNTNTPVATFSFFDTNSAIVQNKVQRSNVILNSSAKSITVGGGSPSALGFTSGITPAISTSLTTSDYSLDFDGTFYRVQRLSDNVIVAQSSSPTISVDGFTISLESGTIIQGDKYIMQPTKAGAKLLDFKIDDPLKLAIGAPIAVAASLANKGNGTIALNKVTNSTGLPSATTGKLGNAFQYAKRLTPPITIEFVSSSQYKVLDYSKGTPGIQLGPLQDYDSNALSNDVFPLPGVLDKTIPGPNAPYTYDPGYRISLSGTMKAGDVFTVDYNLDAASDNRNAIEIVEIQLEKTLSSGTANFQDSYVQMIGEIGTQSAQAKVNTEASKTLLDSINGRRQEVSGVNLDEEAAKLIKFQQAYQAAAQVIMIARSTFDTMIRAFGG